MTIQLNVELETQRCYKCGRYWAHEKGLNFQQCPNCAGLKVHEAGEDRHRLWRRITSLKGVITRLKTKG